MKQVLCIPESKINEPRGLVQLFIHSRLKTTDRRLTARIVRGVGFDSEYQRILAQPCITYLFVPIPLPLIFLSRPTISAITHERRNSYSLSCQPFSSPSLPFSYHSSSFLLRRRPTQSPPFPHHDALLQVSWWVLRLKMRIEAPCMYCRMAFLRLGRSTLDGVGTVSDYDIPH